MLRDMEYEDWLEMVQAQNVPPDEKAHEPVCECGHKRSSHSEEMPYECYDDCDCQSFTYPKHGSEQVVVDAVRRMERGSWRRVKELLGVDDEAR